MEVDEDFHGKRAAMLNTCSMDLMLFLISKSKQEAAKITTEVEKLEEELKSPCSQSVMESKLQETEGSVCEFEARMREINIFKVPP